MSLEMHKGSQLKVNTINCQGLGDISKRRDIFNYLKKKNFNVYFLQDTHFTPNDEKFIQTQWGYKAYFSSFKSNSRGVAILFNNNFEFCILNELYDEGGNYVILDCTVEEHKFILVNIYGPNSDSPSFYSSVLSKIMEIYVEHHIIMAGDFNLIMDKELDSMDYKNINNPKARIEVFHLMDTLNLKDVFREMYPQKKRFSWRKKSPIKQARLDFFLVSESLLSSAMCVEYENSYRSDHSPVLLSLKINNFIKGSGFWKFNNSLLTDKEYVNLIKEKMNEVKTQYACPVYNTENIRFIDNASLCFTICDQLFLDILLTEIRGKTISYSTYKKKRMTKMEDELKKEIQDLEQNLNDNVSDILIEKQKELESMRKSRMKGQAVRARVKWIDEGEKPTKYFCSLESRNYICKQIPRIEKENGSIICKQEKILEELKDFYETLYKKPAVLESDNFSNNLNKYNDIPKLTYDEAQSIEGMLTEKEVLNFL